MSSIPSIDNTPLPPDPTPELPKQGQPVRQNPVALQTELSKEAEARAKEALDALENFGSNRPPGATLGKKRKTNAPGSSEGSGTGLSADEDEAAQNQENAATEAKDAQKDETEAQKLEAQAKGDLADPSQAKRDLAKAKQLLAAAKKAASLAATDAQDANKDNAAIVKIEHKALETVVNSKEAIKLRGEISKATGSKLQELEQQYQNLVGAASSAYTQAVTNQTAAQSAVASDVSAADAAVTGTETAVTGTATAVQADESGYGTGAGSSLLEAVEANPENVVFLAMIDMANTTGKSISAYYAGVTQQNEQIAKLNTLLTQLDNLEEKASAQVNGKGGGPNGTTSTASIQEALHALGIQLTGNANSTQIGDAAQSVNNNISSLSTQSSTTMNELQMLSNNYNTDNQQLSSFLQSVTQTQQGTAHNM